MDWLMFFGLLRGVLLVWILGGCIVCIIFRLWLLFRLVLMMMVFVLFLWCWNIIVVVM